MARAREDFLASGDATISTLRSLSQAFNQATTANARNQRLESFYRKVHFLSATAGLAECHQIAWLASGFEAMLFELLEKPSFIGPSVLRTIAFTVDFLGVLYDRAREHGQDSSATSPANAMVVDDDPVSNRVIVDALRRAQVHAQSAQNPLTALQQMEKKRYDLVLLDIEMPEMDGFEVCKRLRALPGYSNTPVIYVTNHNDFNHRAKSLISGGNDFISKPVFPIELAVKAVMHMLKTQGASCPPESKSPEGPGGLLSGTPL
jgi:CheY-like chemotaxis protein